jgi:hypothetical protein
MLGNDVTIYNITTPISNSRKIVGAGFLGHRDGYNVLYGDWSARWYGDPQQAIIWHIQGYWDYWIMTSQGYHTLAYNHFCGPGADPYLPVPDSRERQRGWHGACRMA